MGKVITSLSSTGRENYNEAMLGLIRSINRNAPDYDTHLRSVDGYVDEYQGRKILQGKWPKSSNYESWSHQNMPYQFKPVMVAEAYELGYRKIIWCDSTIRVMKNPDPLWELAAEHGIVAWNNEGHPLHKYIPDHQIAWLGLRDYTQVMQMYQIMACCIVFDFDHPATKPIFDKWIDGAFNNCFHHNESKNPHYVSSRHDQSLLSAIMNLNGVKVQPYGGLAYREFMPVAPFFINWGVKD
jgi:hypothetical protein